MTIHLTVDEKYQSGWKLWPDRLTKRHLWPGARADQVLLQYSTVESSYLFIYFMYSHFSFQDSPKKQENCLYKSCVRHHYLIHLTLHFHTYRYCSQDACVFTFSYWKEETESPSKKPYMIMFRHVLYVHQHKHRYFSHEAWIFFRWRM